MERMKRREKQLGKPKKIEKYLQLGERMTKLQKKQYLLGKERSGLSRNGALNKLRHSSDPSDRLQNQRGRDGRENRTEKQRGTSFRTDSSDEEESEQSVSDSDSLTEDEHLRLSLNATTEERIASARIINQPFPSDSESGGDASKKGLGFTRVDIKLPKGFGDEPLPHAVPIVGLRSSRSSARTARSSARSHSAVTSARIYSAGSTFRSPYAKAPSKSSTRSLSAKSSTKSPVTKNSARLPPNKTSARSHQAQNSTRTLSSKVSSRSSSPTSSDGSTSPRTYNVIASNATSATSRSSRVPPSAVSQSNLPGPVFPHSTNGNITTRKTWIDGAQPPGYWETVSDERQGNLNSICVWALTDPPEPPPGIVWKRVTPPPSPGPPPTHKEDPIKTDVLTKDDQVNKDQHPDSSVSSVPIVPELVPSVDPAVSAPKTVIRKVVVMPVRSGYPGFCDSSEALQTLRSKKSISSENVGEKKRLIVSQKDESNKKMNSKLSKEPSVRLLANVHEGNKKNGLITPSAWRSGLKYAKKELGPWKVPVHSDDIDKNNGIRQQHSDLLQEKLKDIHKYVDKTEKKLSDYKLQKMDEKEQDGSLSGANILHIEPDKSENSKTQKAIEKYDKSKSDDAAAVQESLGKHVLNHISLKEDNNIFHGENNQQVKNDDDINTAPVKNVNHRKNSQKMVHKRPLGTKSAHNLNNAFIAGEDSVLPKRANSFSNFPHKAVSESKEDPLSKCAQTSRQYDPQIIKQYIRTQKKLRHRKLLEEIERKKIQEEKKRTKLLELRSKSKELVEESLKKKSKCVKKELEFLQMLGMQLGEIELKAPLKEKNETQDANTNQAVLSSLHAEKECPSLQHSNSALGSQESSDVNVPPKSVIHVALQTEEELLKSVSDSIRNKIVDGSGKLASSLRLPSVTCEPNLSISKVKLIDRETNINENDSSKSESCKVVLDQKLCNSIQREIKKLSRNIYVLEKHKMIGIFPEKHDIPSTSTQREVPLKNSFETTERLKSDLNNKNVSLIESERQMLNKTSDSRPVNCSDSVALSNAQNYIHPMCLSLTPDMVSKSKSSVNNLTAENENTGRSHGSGDAVVKIQTLFQGRSRKATSAYNALPLQIQDIKQNHSSASDSFVSEGPLHEEDIANVGKVIEPQSNNLCENAPLKNAEEKKKEEVPFWLRKPPMESHPFNFISAVKMKLNRYLEEQSKNIEKETPSNVVQPLKPMQEEISNGKESAVKESGTNIKEQEVQYESDFETTAPSGSLPSHGDAKINASTSSDLDTATEEILPTDEVPQTKAPLPSVHPRIESNDSDSDNFSSASKKGGSVASIQSHFSNSDYQLVAPDFTLSRSGRDKISKNVKDSTSKSSIPQLENEQNSRRTNSSDGKFILSMPDAVFSNKSDQSASYGSCKTEISVASKSRLMSIDNSVPNILSEYKKISPALTLRSTLEGDLSPQLKEIVSSNSAESLDRLHSDGNQDSSRNESFHHDGLHLPIKADFKLQHTHQNVTHERKTNDPYPSVLPQQGKVLSAKEISDNHCQKFAQMEQKAFEHRLEMERAFEKERRKLELALEEAKKTVFDSKLEASKFISDAAVELVRSQAEATKANAEATKHLSEAKVMDSLKLETISAQSASAAAFAAVQAAMKQLQNFKKVKHISKKHVIQEDSFTSTKSEISSSSTEQKSRDVNDERESEESSVLLKNISEETQKVEKLRTNSEAANAVEKDEQSAQNIEKTVDKQIAEDSSLHSISENISEPEYSSKFDETASEVELKSAPKAVEGNADAAKLPVPETKGIPENKKAFSHFRKKSEFKMDIHDLDSTIDTVHSLESPQLNEQSSNTDQDSFTKFSLSMFQQLMREEEMRAQHQQALLKLREDALIDKTKAEMILLELKKKQYRDKGQEDAVSSIRKKQRGLLIRLKLEKDEIQRLKKSHKTASHERRMMLIQQQHIVKMRMSTKEIMNKLHTKKLPPTPKAIRSMGFIGSVLDTSKSTVEINTEESALDTRSHSSAVPEELQYVDATCSDASLPTAPVHSSHASFSDSESHNGQKRDTRRLEKQVIHGLNDLERNKKFLSEREKNLMHRRQAVEELLLWRKRLEQEEERVRALESQALVPHSQSRKAQTSFRSSQELSVFKADRSTSPLHLESSVEVKLREDAATSMADLSSAHSESILEDVPNESQKSSLSVVDDVESDSKKNQFVSEHLESSNLTSVIKTQVSAEELLKDSASVNGMRAKDNESKSEKSSILPVSAKEESKRSSLNITIKSPLTPYIPGRQKRRHSSGSDESIILSQNETASEQSDIESKICALQEQLRRRKMEAELLKREQKKCHRERLKAKEQSLIKQIQAYDLYIQRARMELEQECESPSTSLVKPQIKQPRVGDWKKKVDEPKEVTEKVSAVESIAEVIEKTPLESLTEFMGKTSTCETLSEVAEKTHALKLQPEESGNIAATISAEPPIDSQIQNNSSSSLSEILEEIPIPAEEVQVLDNSQCSLSRGSSVETTIESPTKPDITETPRGDNAEDLKQTDIASESVNITPPEHYNGIVKEAVASDVADPKSDKYDEDTFEPTTTPVVEAEGFSVNKQNGKIESLENPISEEIVEDLSYSGSFEQHDPLASEVSDVDNLTMTKTNENEKEIVADHHYEEEFAKSVLEQASEESISLPSYIFVEHSVPWSTFEETYIVSAKPEEIIKENDDRADLITENIFRNLFEESVVEAEILMNKSSTCTQNLLEINENVSKLVPFYEVENYEEVIEQNIEEMEFGSSEMMKVVNVYCEEWKDTVFTDQEVVNLANEVISIPSQADIVSGTLLQLLLEDATLEMIKILEKRESCFKLRKESVTTAPDSGTHNKNSEVIKRVQQIMFESSLSQVTQREKSRPQDLMITTYDVMSPDSSNCSSPILGQSDMELVFVQDEKLSPKSPHKYQTGKGIPFLQVEHGGGLGASSAGGESAGAENEAFSQDWFEEDFGLNSSLREVEEIQLQRLRIEREIEQLQLAQAKEQQQRQYPCNFYIREIPNKPPPPYTPPEETPRISASVAGPISPLGTPRDPSPRAVVPTEQEEVAIFIRTSVAQFYDAWNRGESLDSVEPPPLKFVSEEEEEYLNEGVIEGEVRKKSRRTYSHFLFDLSRQLVDESLDNVEGEKWVSVPTKFGSRKLKPALPLPSRDQFLAEVEKQAMITLGFIPRETRDNFMFSWILKKRDHIDEILMREVQEEDRYWTNFDEEERYLKEQIAESLFEVLLADTTKAVAVAYERRERRFSSTDG